MTFGTALKESILEMMFGARQLAAWRAEKKQREECERIMQKHYEDYRRSIS